MQRSDENTVTRHIDIPTSLSYLSEKEFHVYSKFKSIKKGVYVSNYFCCWFTFHAKCLSSECRSLETCFVQSFTSSTKIQAQAQMQFVIDKLYALLSCCLLLPRNIWASRRNNWHVSWGQEPRWVVFVNKLYFVEGIVRTGHMKIILGIT